MEMIPQDGRLADSRTATTRVSAQSVSPAKTGLGNLMSVHPKFATAFSDVSRTESPNITRAADGPMAKMLRHSSCQRSHTALSPSQIVYFRCGQHLRKGVPMA